MDSGDHQEGGSESQLQLVLQHPPKRQRRRTPHQIQALEASFEKCSHPNKTERAQLGHEIGLDAKQVLFWFQNRRAQIKIDNERAEVAFLRAENAWITSENIAMREKLKLLNNGICFNCVDREGFDQYQLRKENALLKSGLLVCTTSYQEYP